MKAIYFVALLMKLVACERKVVIGGIFPMSGGWAGGQACLPAVNMAIMDVNARQDILPGYSMELVSKDSKCDPGLGARMFYDILQDERIFAVLTGCSSVSTPIAESAFLWNMNVIAYGASSPALSNRTRFPTFYRTHPSANLHNPTRVQLFLEFGWKRVGIINQDSEVFASTAKDLAKQFRDNGVALEEQQTFYTDPKVAVQNLKKADVRIIVGLFYEGAARQVMCEAFKMKLFGKRYVWFLIGWYKYGWFLKKSKGVNCTAEEMSQAVEGHFTTEIVMLNPTDQITVSGMSSSTFTRRLNSIIGDPRNTGGYEEASLAYDAVWAVALALNATIGNASLQPLSRNNNFISKAVYKALNATSFLGISGNVAFDYDGSRTTSTRVDRLENGSYVQILVYNAQKNKIEWKKNINWDQPPRDRMLSVIQRLRLPKPLFIALLVAAFVSLVFCSICIVFNCYKSSESYVARTAPMLNTISLMGNMVLLSVIGTYGTNITSTTCLVRTWLLVLGSSLSFLPLFSKVWTVSSLYKKSLMRSDKSEVKVARNKVHMSVTYETVAVIVISIALDLAVLISWTITDPLQRSERRLEEVHTKNDSVIIQEVWQCSSRYSTAWIGGILAYKGIQLLLGSFLAYESRSKIKSDSDHKQVGMAIYNNTVLAFFCAPVAFLLSGQPDLYFCFVSCPIIVCSFASSFIIFLPKWRDALEGRSSELESPNVPPPMGSVRDMTSPEEPEEVILKREIKRLRREIANVRKTSKDALTDEKEKEIEKVRSQIKDGIDAEDREDDITKDLMETNTESQAIVDK